MQNEFLHELLIDSLKDLYSAEKQLVTKGLPAMIAAATNPELKAGFEEHLVQTEEQVVRLEEVAKLLGDIALYGKKCIGIEGIITEGEELIKMDLDQRATDFGLNSGGMKVEHYEMVEYTAAVMLAKLMGHEEAAQLLEQTLNEEMETNEKLETLAEAMVTELSEE